MCTPWKAHQVPLDCSEPVITQMPWGQLNGSQNKTKNHEHRKGTSKGVGAGRYWREVIEGGG